MSEKISAIVTKTILLQRYVKYLKGLYIEPKEEKIMGTFLTVNEIKCNPSLQQSERNRKVKKISTFKSKDIRKIFGGTGQQEQSSVQ